MAILYSPRNLARDAGLRRLQSGAGVVLAEPAGFPIDNGIDLRPGTVLRFPSLTTGRVVFDFSSSPGGAPVSTPGIAGLLNHNLASDATLRVQSAGSTAGPWTTRGTFTLTGGEKKLWCDVSGVSAAVWAYYLEALGSTAAAPQFECWLGSKVTLTRNAAWGVTPNGYIARTRVVESEFGWEHVYFLSQSDRFIGQMPGGLSDANLAEVVDLVQGLRGNTDPLFFVGDSSKVTGYIGRSRITEIDPQAQAVGRWANVRLEVVEVPWGKQPQG
jgi:hypothetical protein